MSVTAIILSWVVVLAPALFYLTLSATYRPILYGRKAEIRSIMERGETFKEYIKAFGSSPDKTLDKTLDSLFYRTYGEKRYYFPVIATSLLSAIAVMFMFIRLGVGLLPADICKLISTRLSLESLAAMGGALIWGMYDAVQRFEAIELTPTSLHYMALRLIIAPVIAPLAALALSDSFKMLAAFAIGAFPVKTLVEFVKGKARSKLNITGEPAEGPTLQNLQGVTPEMLRRLQDQGFESTEHLAGADPVKLLLKTNISWKVILDLIDQSILFGYVREKAKLLPPFGIRGAIELATIQDDLDDDKPETHRRAEELVKCLAGVLETKEAAVLNMIGNAYADVQVNLIWLLWGDEDFVAEDEGDDSNTNAGAAAVGSEGPPAQFSDNRGSLTAAAQAGSAEEPR